MEHKGIVGSVKEFMAKRQFSAPHGAGEEAVAKLREDAMSAGKTSIDAGKN